MCSQVAKLSSSVMFPYFLPHLAQFFYVTSPSLQATSSTIRWRCPVSKEDLQHSCSECRPAVGTSTSMHTYLEKYACPHVRPSDALNVHMPAAYCRDSEACAMSILNSMQGVNPFHHCCRERKVEISPLCSPAGRYTAGRDAGGNCCGDREVMAEALVRD